MISRKLSPSIHKFGNEFIHSGLSAALGHELGPNGVSSCFGSRFENTLPYLRIEALSLAIPSRDWQKKKALGLPLQPGTAPFAYQFGTKK